ncbi:UNVERIFIED_CONTAM: hypothetical protein PYX00_007496 [Menopon gallinae]|uniref:G-protein coupled receptors family 1 profile domain-containing protein n=1 Tax=Menopon gallinae TaxID=328185 RepID=A0AAW2HJY6_9NEOP
MNDTLWLAGEVEEEILSNKSNNLNSSWNYTASNGTEVDWEKLAQERAVLAVVLALFSVATVFGNVLVILAVARERYLHTSTNYFVTSLAVADCLVGLVVMPLSATHEVFFHNWYFGTDWCDIWRSLDVLFSTASILNLCVISLDRYWAITDPFTYPTRMSRRKAAALIAGVWVCSATISFPAIAWWRAVQVKEPPPLTCPFTENFGYLMFSSTISFYLPLFVMNSRIPAKHISKNFSVSRKLAKFAKEKKAAKTLGIVMGVFIVCWLPFFVVNLLSGICNQCIWQEELVSSIVTWLGWINSSMNPVIYACWSRDFRR